MSTPTIPGASNVTSIAEARKGRGRPAGSAAKEHPTIPADEFVIEDIDRENRGALKRVRKEWTREEEAVARKTLAVYKLWKEAGSPSDWNLMPVQGWVISKQYEEEALRLLYKGASKHSLKRVLGNIQRRPLPDLPLPDGKVRIPFCIVARKTEVTGLPAADDSGAAESQQ
jgi:hypothetical protein